MSEAERRLTLWGFCKLKIRYFDIHPNLKQGNPNIGYGISETRVKLSPQPDEL